MSTATAMDLAYVNPAEIIIDNNVRTVIDIDPLFYESIRDFGVQSPPTCWRDDKGHVHVERGQRRVLAAVQAQLKQIPVLIVPRDIATAEREYDLQRIVGQLSENEHRTGLTDGDRVAAYEQLTLFGMSADEIAKATKAKRGRVRDAVKLLQKAPTATAELEAKQLTLDDALRLAEFENDEPERAQLLETIQTDPDNVDQRLARLKQARDKRRALEQLAAEAKAMKIKWVDPDKGKIGWWNSPYEPLKSLRIGKATTEPTVDEARAQGGLVASAVEQVTRENGVMTRTWSLGFWVKDYKDHGYRIPRSSSGSTVNDMTDEEREKARKERAAKRERKTAWAAACELRQTWIRDTLLQPALVPPVGAELWVLKALLEHRDVPYQCPNYAGSNAARELALTWIGADAEPGEDSYARARPGFLAAAETHPGRSEMMVALAYILACTERVISDPKNQSYAYERSIGAYLRQLEAWGYPLTEVEVLVAKTERQG